MALEDLENGKCDVNLILPVQNLFLLIIIHYENTPIQMYRKFHHQKLKIFN